MRFFALAKLLIYVFFLNIMGCGMYLRIPHESVSDPQISQLHAMGFTTIDAGKILEMQHMVRPDDLCSGKRNVCGLHAGISATFVLQPQEAFYDVSNAPRGLKIGDGSKYDKLYREYPIMRPKAFPKLDVGLFSTTLAEFWSRNLQHHKAQALGFDEVRAMTDKAKEEIRAGRPVLCNVRIPGEGRPLYMPDEHLGLRGFVNSHWVVLLGFNDDEWLVRDNGGLGIMLDRGTNLIRITNDSLEKIADLTEQSDDIKLYLKEKNLPVFLDDWDNSNNDEQLRTDFRQMRSYNIVVFSPKS